MTEFDMRKSVRDYLNDTINATDELSTTDLQLMSDFDLIRCDGCNNFELEECMINTEGVINGGIGLRCETCKEDM